MRGKLTSSDPGLDEVFCETMFNSERRGSEVRCEGRWVSRFRMPVETSRVRDWRSKGDSSDWG